MDRRTTGKKIRTLPKTSKEARKQNQTVPWEKNTTDPVPKMAQKREKPHRPKCRNHKQQKVNCLKKRKKSPSWEDSQGAAGGRNGIKKKNLERKEGQTPTKTICRGSTASTRV